MKVIAFLLGFASLAAAADAGERLVVEYAKEFTGAKSGLEYRYTFKVETHKSKLPVAGADFTVATDMASMPGAHHMPHVKGEPGAEPGSYHATIDFDMAGSWSLILRFTKPQRDQVVLTDTVERQAPGEGDAVPKHHHGQDRHKGH